MFSATGNADTAAATVVWAPTAARKIEELLGPFLAGAEGMPDFELVQILVGRLVAHHEKRITETGQTTEGYRTTAVRIRIDRDQAAKALREELRRARCFFDQCRKGERRATAFLSGFYQLCGLDDFAKKVRPAFRRPPRRRKGKKAKAAPSPNQGS